MADKNTEKPTGEEAKKAEEETPKKEEEKPVDPAVKAFNDLGASAKVIMNAVVSREYRGLTRVVRSIAGLRRVPFESGLRKYVDAWFEDNDPLTPLLQANIQAGDVDMTSGTEEAPQPMTVENLGMTVKNGLVEVQAYVAILCLVRVLDKKNLTAAKEIADAMVAKFKVQNRRSLDALTAQMWFYYARVYELLDNAAETRGELLAAYRTASLHHDAMGQATLLNLLLRNYLHYNLYDQAFKLAQKTTFPETRSNAQYARYLFYIGRIKAVRLEYSEAHSKLLQAIRKAPQGPQIGRGFRLAATKLAIVVELLMGEIPSRSTFTQRELSTRLKPYFAITQAVRLGDLSAFSAVQAEHEALWRKDKTLTLINRLRYNVIRAGLRNVNLSYSKIGFADVAAKLGLESHEEASGVIAKAIVDGVIDAKIDHDAGFVQSKSDSTLDTVGERSRALHRRIAFCLQLHNDSVRAMQYPEKQDDKKGDGETADQRRERENQELAGGWDDDDEDDFI
mmetsp:Transcript_11058/g.23793  ORF Transcript_11058/g.23793 Transcript_11058/m.23793 type:complete len:508 (-) Transcript_11058:111-1634(-)